MSDVPFSIALRLAGQDYALEPGRDYLIGSAVECDLRHGGAAARHARLCIDARTAEVLDLGPGTLRNGEGVTRATLAIGDVLRFGELEAIVVKDGGEALLVPIPALRAEARLRAVRVAAAALRHGEADSFGNLMAEELRRAPWLACSLVLHVVLLLLLWLWLPERREGGDKRAVVGIELGTPSSFAEAPAPPPVVVEPPEPPPDPVPEPEPPVLVEPPPAPAVTEPTLHTNPRVVLGGSSTPANNGEAGEGMGSGEFRQAVGELRKSGLEIVFVFDSTGSMTRTITDTKSTIVQMLTVLRVLVPDARIGLVTYRDRGVREDYLVRQLPLDTDFWRASNFVQFVQAEGGGDRPEDVRAGLRAAFAQNWNAHARRVVVLAGDAPPHAEDVPKLLTEVRSFTQNGRSFVHTLVTSPDLAGDETQVRFEQIAKAGNGTCTDLRAHDRVLQRVLTAAFGHEYDQDLAAVVRAVTAARAGVDVAALDLARRGGPDLVRELRRDPVPVTVLNALVRRPRRGVTHELVDQLANPATPAHTRQAIASVLQRILELPWPPIDPSTGERPDAREISRLRVRVSNLPN